MSEALLQEVDPYLSRRQNTVAHFIVTSPIMYLFLVAERILGPQVSKRWWDQYRLDMEGMRTADREAERTEGG